MFTKTEALAKIADLITRFEEQLPSYKKSEYNETLARRDFIDPFFKALGWDVDNSLGYAEAYREVIHEDKVNVGGATKAPDYSFRLVGGKRLFFLEAKKPSVVVKDEIQPAYQVRRYGWSAAMPISVMTDFEEFAIYDCTIKPIPTDKASKARVRYLTYKEYIAEWDFIWDTFSKEQVLKGGFDKFIDSNKNKKGTGRVDTDFLTSLDEWRKALASSISYNNTSLDEDEINYAVQQTIDRIIFLRIAEDRSVEPYGNLQNALNGDDFYKNLLHVFKEADAKYNSGLFDFKKDKISRTLTIDNKAIRTIISQLYYPTCPYEFSVLPVEILGSAYEQFLGKVIRIDSAHRARIEEKPEVRKAGGVYYTPQYIVDYIVEHTLGTVIKERASTPEAISALRVVDPACGSGSFLIGAYQYLLDWHLNYYTEQSKLKTKKTNTLTPDGHLTTAEKKRILLNNIYGVDIDVNAVEVTKLSLLLKCMEGETHASIAHQMAMFSDRVLPTLDDNIKSGNSLIDLDFYASQLDFGEEKKIKPFSWEKGFSEVFKGGGFDVVIGNPPYLRMQGLQETQPFAIEYYKQHYQAASTGNYDIYVLFDEKGLKLLNNKGLLGFIQPHKFFQAEFGEGIRNLIIKEKALKHIVHFGAHQIFEDASTYSCLLFLKKNNTKPINVSNVPDLPAFINDKMKAYSFNSKLPLLNSKWNFVSQAKEALFEKLNSQKLTLGDITRKIFQGIPTGSDKIFVLKTLKVKENTILCYSAALNKEIELEKSILKPFLMGKEVKRYEVLNPENNVIFPYVTVEGKPQLMSDKILKADYPKTWSYFQENKNALNKRENERFKLTWWQYSRPQNLTEFESVKLCTPEIAIKPQLSLDVMGNIYHTTKVYSFIFKESIKEHLNYFLAVLNSKLLWYFLSSTGYVLRGGYFVFKTEYLKPFPIKLIDFKSKEEVKIYNEIISLVDQLLQLHQERAVTKLESKLVQIQTKIDYCEGRVDELVYGLYGLTEEERKVVEGDS